MAPLEIIVACRPQREHVTRGEGVPVVIELRNDGSRPLNLLPMSVPWLYHHAVRFEVVDGPAQEPLLWVLDPPDGPEVVIPAHESLSGQVDLAEYLGRDGGTTRLNDFPGSYRLRADVTVVAVEPTADPSDYDRAEVTSEPFTVVIDA